MKKDFSSVTKYFRKYKKYLIFGFISVIISNTLLLFTPYISKMVFDALQKHQPSSVILQLVLIMIGLALFSGIFRFAMRRTIIWMSRYIEYDLRGEIFNKLLHLPQTFYHNNRIGDMMARMTNDLEAVRQVIGPGIMYISDTVVKLTISFAFMFYLSPKLTLYAVIPLLFLSPSVYLIGNILHRRSMRVQEKFSQLTAVSQENLSGIRVVKAYRQENNEIKNFSKISKSYIKLNMDLAKIQGVFMPSMRFLAALSYLAVFYLGGKEIIKGGLGLGDIVAFFGYLSMILWPMIAIGWVTSLYQRGKASIQRINRILFAESEVEDSEQSLYDKPISGKIEFRNLSFAYNGTIVLKDINLTIAPGETVGLVGKTGSGKTTLVSLLARLFQVDRGKLFIDDRDINDWKLSALRSQIGFAPQEPFLFSNTVMENIRFGKADADQEQIRTAARTAALDSDIESFKNGYETVVGERGVTLSGGQKQRAAIARAVLTDPSILILDDVTSAVDTETEDKINSEIKKVLQNRTAVIISHRVSSVKEADRILYLENGRIVEQGSHDQLIELNGRYASLYRKQLLEMELESL